MMQRGSQAESGQDPTSTQRGELHGPSDYSKWIKN